MEKGVRAVKNSIYVHAVRSFMILVVYGSDGDG